MIPECPQCGVVATLQDIENGKCDICHYQYNEKRNTIVESMCISAVMLLLMIAAGL